MGWIVNQIAEHLHINQVCFLLYFQASAVDSGAAKWVSKSLPTMLWKLHGQTVLQDLSATGTTTESLSENWRQGTLSDLSSSSHSSDSSHICFVIYKPVSDSAISHVASAVVPLIVDLSNLR